MQNDTANSPDSSAGPERLPVSVLTGFLGSGKTTVLNALLKHPDMGQTAVIINEFGEVGIDNLLVETASEDMVVMESGCLCCTIRGDLIETLRGLIKRRWNNEIPAFNRVVIETTGLADPAPILHTLMTDPVISTRYRLDGVITTVDAVNGSATLDAQPEAVKQAAVADRILLTKTDLMEQESDLMERLRVINPAAPVLSVIQGDIAPDALFGTGLYDPGTKTPDVAQWLAEEAYDQASQHGHPHDHTHGHHHDHDRNRHDDRIRSFVIRYDAPIAWDAFVNWIEALIATHGANLLRMKGILYVAEVDGPVAVHGVQHVFHPPALLAGWAEGETPSSRLVIIARDLNKDPVEKMFHAFMAQ
ncbi:MAG: GTP-binding protein [Rhodospirillales bacterium]|jgi:G3E family GTPase|uniref:CobW family GTP-binding protein n=1 Tax=Hwanghaeella sp. 1Z406 TaxID=3402811 RepID=UPI000C8BFC0C|nr:GTP-binding protein [Rhodospirillales bacterium]MAO90450.1 GTP-binding protein [Rhodospirillales bacterium]|tara:strand:- start:1019 stop:2101 length:1083 start_codon:yes stop_codon:yes gene_type:complete